MEREIPRLIIEKNLYGLDIDDRAYQLACFSVVMKALEYNPRFLRSIERDGLKLNLASIQETQNINEEEIIYLVGENNGKHFIQTREFFEQFKNAKTLGSLIMLQEYDEEFIRSRFDQILTSPVDDIFKTETRQKLIELVPLLLKQANIMSMKYDILVTNPPYIGNKFLNNIFSNYIDENYPDVKSDLFSSFIEYSFTKVKENGHIGFMTPFVWMFIASYEKLRRKIISQKTISSLIQLEYSAFEEATVPICTFTLRNYFLDITGEYIRLSDFKGSESQPIKTLEAIKNPNVNYRYTVKSKNFERIPGSPIAYWASETILKIFETNKKLSNVAEPKVGLQTGDNDRFLRLWTEVDINKIGFGMRDTSQAKESKYKWFPYNKGGLFRKWYGNNEFIVNWENDGLEIKNFKDENGKFKSRPQNTQYYFQEAITWSKITSGKLSLRYVPHGYIFDVAGTSIFGDKDVIVYLLGLLNSKVSEVLIGQLSQTLNFEVGHLKSIPVIFERNNLIPKIVEDCIEISKNDWDSFETSWEFKRHPLLMQGTFRTIQQAYEKWSDFTERRFNELKENEEQLNRIFIEIYGLQNELIADIAEEDITIRKAERERDIKSFISYAVGCMFGRYSLDEEGVIYAGGKFIPERYQTFKADKDNILPILSGTYFENDIVSRFIEFVQVTFGEETLTENLEFIADTLGKKNGETAKETIRRYFLNEFYKDHVQTYKKRPIYWLFTSGKQKAFNCLIYMHRYDKTTLSRIRTDYVHPLQMRMDAERKSLLSIIEGNGTAREINNAKKQLKDLDKKIEELKEYEERLHHMADMQIEIDLDDGVAVNYEKFKGLLAKLE
jgi:type II restriction/modification system DNA methylase subunit YeeA